MRYTLGLDMGVTSIGWSVIELNQDDEPADIVAMGVRKFSSGREDKTGAPLTQARRQKRSMRRQRERFLRREKKLLNKLKSLELMPSTKAQCHLVATCLHGDIHSNDPYTLRGRATREQLTPYELGRTLFALHVRRGFKSNRKEEQSTSKEFYEGITALHQKIEAGHFPTLGAYFEFCVKNNKPILDKRGSGDSLMADRKGLQTERKMYEDEFRYIQKIQSPHFQLTEKNWDELYHIIFHQRPLQEVEKGYCQLLGSGYCRAYKADPLAQKLRLLQDVNNLRVLLPEEKLTRHLTDDERQKLFHALSEKASMSFGAVKTLLKLPADATFNLEKAKSDKLKGLETDIKLSKTEWLGEVWHRFSSQQKTEIISLLQSNKDSEDLITQFVETYNIPEEKAELLAQEGGKLKLESGTARFSTQALALIYERMSTKVADEKDNRYESLTESYEALRAADEKPKKADKLGYYAQMMPEVGMHQKFRAAPQEKDYGIIGNPTVHIGLGQLQKVVNAIVETYGAPTKIALEIARDLKMNDEQKRRHEKTRKDNEKLREEMVALCEKEQVPINAQSRKYFMKYKLWKELDADPCNRLCPYSGEKISLSQLMSEQVNIEHILPRSWSLDDSLANLTVSKRDPNKMKGNLTPYEYFSKYEHDKLAAMLQRASRLPNNKKWRFTDEARKRFSEGEAGWRESLLNDTKYLSKLSRRYLSFICDDVRVSPGKLTSKARQQWFGGVLRKDRAADHTHHAVDALLVALLDRKAVQMAQTLSAKDDETGRLYHSLALPCPMARSHLHQKTKELLKDMVVSHRVDHGEQGALHEDTALAHAEKSKHHQLSIEALKRRKRQAKAVQKFKDTQKGINTNLVKISHQQGEIVHHNFYQHGGVHHIDVWKLPTSGKVEVVPVYMHEAHVPKGSPKKQTRPHPAAKFIMRLHKGDAIKAKRNDGKEMIAIVRKISPSDGNKCIEYLPVNQAGTDYELVRFSQLISQNVRKVHVDILGRVKEGIPKFYA